MNLTPNLAFSFLGKPDLNKVVNVASVPQLSPFRYPGGKTWLIPHIRQWLSGLPRTPKEMIEPFAGGAIVSLTVAAEQLAESVTLVELDSEVAAVWRTILNGQAEWLANRIIAFNLTRENAEKVFSEPAKSLRDKAFRTILKNRVFHGGILAHGSGFLKYGENGKGILSRWYPETLRKRILNIARMRKRIRFIEGDGFQVLKSNAHRTDVVYFLDPPYTAAGKKPGTRLYKHYSLDHEELFRIVSTLKGDFLITYENADGVQEMARRHGFDMQLVPMKGTHHNMTMELLIGKDLNWARDYDRN